MRDTKEYDSGPINFRLIFRYARFAVAKQPKFHPAYVAIFFFFLRMEAVTINKLLQRAVPG